MKVLIWFHVLSAIIGIGPTFLFGLFLQKNQSALQLRHSLKLMDRAVLFNKIGAPLAALSGITLVLLESYGGWLQLWILGALFLYVLITAIAIPLGAKGKSLQAWVDQPEHSDDTILPSEQAGILKQMNTSVNVIHVLSIVLFSLMILKPVVFK